MEYEKIEAIEHALMDWCQKAAKKDYEADPRERLAIGRIMSIAECISEEL